VKLGFSPQDASLRAQKVHIRPYSEPFHIFTSCVPKFYMNIILPSTIRSSKLYYFNFIILDLLALTVPVISYNAEYFYLIQ